MYGYHRLNKMCGKLHYMPPPLRTVWPSSSPYTPYACGAQRALLPVAVGAMNIHDVCDRQTASLLNAPAWGHKYRCGLLINKVNVPWISHVLIQPVQHNCYVAVAALAHGYRLHHLHLIVKL